MISTVAIVATEFVAVAIVCGLLVKYYQSPLVTPDVSTTVYISWVLGYAAVLILPYDLSIAVVEQQKSSVLQELWGFVYWSTFCLAWLILPIQMEYHNSGHFTFKEKLLDALKTLGMTILAVIFIATIYLVYILSTHQSTLEQVIGFAMAMSNTYGILLITVFMGSGLASIPKRLWAMGNTDTELTRLYLAATHVEDAYQEARYDLEDCEIEVKRAIQANQNIMDNAMYISILQNRMENFNFANKSTTRAFVKSDPSKNKDYTSKSELVSLHAKLKKCQLRARASEQRWRFLIMECKQLKDSQNPDVKISDLEANWCLMPISSEETGETTSGRQSSVTAMICNACNHCYYKVYQFWITRCFTPTCRIAAIICAFLSIILLWCELLMSSNLESPIGYFMGAYQSTTEPILVQAVAFIALAYMSICSYWTLFRLNIGWYYRLQGPQLSAPSSLIFNAEYLSRIQFALGYNFLLCLNIKSTKYTAFSDLMQNMELIPVFGTQFTVYVPIVMIIMALITFFDLFARMLQMFGIESEEANVTPGQWCQWTNASTSIENSLTTGMNTELLEKYKTGKTIIENEIRMLHHQNEQLKFLRESNNHHRNTPPRGGRETEGIGSTSRDSSINSYPNKIHLTAMDAIRPILLPSVSSSASNSRHNHEDDDEDIEVRTFGITRNSGSNNSGKEMSNRYSIEREETVVSRGGSKLLPSLGTSTFMSKGYSKLAKGPEGQEEIRESRTTVRKKDFFSFLDDDENQKDSSSGGGGRYGNF